jgi:hypothetical protein
MRFTYERVKLEILDDWKFVNNCFFGVMWQNKIGIYSIIFLILPLRSDSAAIRRYETTADLHRTGNLSFLEANFQKVFFTAKWQNAKRILLVRSILKYHFSSVSLVE